jgi:hypothetical protein
MGKTESGSATPFLTGAAPAPLCPTCSVRGEAILDYREVFKKIMSFQEF